MLYFGDYTDLSKVGILFSNTMAIPSEFSGSAALWQVIYSTVARYQTNDTGRWYKFQTVNVADAIPMNWNPYPLVATDSPQEGHFFDYKGISRDDSFGDWLMFQPSDGQWVPLRRVDWSWEGSAALSSGTWSLTSSNHTIGAVVDTTQYPWWTNNIRNLFEDTYPPE